MSYKIVSDSASDILSLNGIDYASVPLKIRTKDKEYTDNKELDVENMIKEISETKGPSGSSCPNVGEWLSGFGNADNVFGVAISSGISGSCQAAMQAKREYEEANPRAKVFIVDTKTAGPEMKLIIEKLKNMILGGHTFEEIKDAVQEYLKHTNTFFMLESLLNFARNGRVNPAVAKIAGILGIRVIGKASDSGTLQPMHKVRGEKPALITLYNEMKASGFAAARYE